MAIQILSAQGVFEIAWNQGINNTVASPTIALGDTVKWTWADASPKSVTSLSNGSEDFDSGTLKGLNSEYSHTFTKIGETEYQNDLDPTMYGMVTVSGKLSIEEKFVKNLSFYPNPVKNYLTISSQFRIDSYQIFNVLGTLVSKGVGAGTSTLVDMSRLNSGLYFVKVSAKDMQTTIKIAKQ